VAPAHAPTPRSDSHALERDVSSPSGSACKRGRSGCRFQVITPITYKLSPDNSPTTTLTVNKNSRRCGASDQPSALCGQSCRAQLRSGCTGLQPYEACIGGCTGFYDVFGAPQCNHHLDDWGACIAATPPGPSWQCYPEGAPGTGDGVADVPACAPLVEAFFECAFGE
jgi:hypothetical protein